MARVGDGRLEPNDVCVADGAQWEDIGRLCSRRPGCSRKLWETTPVLGGSNEAGVNDIGTAHLVLTQKDADADFWHKGGRRPRMVLVGAWRGAVKKTAAFLSGAGGFFDSVSV